MPNNSNRALIFPGREPGSIATEYPILPPLKTTGDNQSPFYQINIGGTGVAGIFRQVPAISDTVSNQIVPAHVETSQGGFSPPLKVFGNAETLGFLSGPGVGANLPVDAKFATAESRTFRREDIGEIRKKNRPINFSVLWWQSLFN